jgi:hypothetical protein
MPTPTMIPTIPLDRVRPCPWCHEANTHADCFSGPEGPSTGDVSLCSYCGRWSIFEATDMRKPTDAELVEIAEDPDCRSALAAYRWERSRGRRRMQ